MGRRCVVPSCSSTDLTMLVHRFPRKHCTAWQRSLQLNSYALKDLLDKYVVCAHHFRSSDYRHRESKHLNTTAIPTLDDIPDADKIPDCRTSIHKPNKRSNVAGSTAVSDSVTPHLNSNLTIGRTYSNCVSSALSPVTKLTGSRDPIEHDILMEERFYTDGDIIEEETAMDEVMLLLDSDVSPTDIPECVSVTVNYEEEVDVDTYTEQETFIDEILEEDENCDNVGKMMVSRADYVDLIEAKDETDYDDDEDDGCELVDENEILFKDYSRNDLINELLSARSRIKELETKLGNIQQAHMSVLQNLNNFNKVLIS
ncbi:uncharacterized protein LOC119067425 [Bradysia coprophila]|uniref:uncharacterized protein LOC119067425 n=1 Tax=Bradysia coprophila TaxID=38358 RepID=UPI00187DD6B6|nr:uncharacterized protein LOC119067425 [Bradysia coprophila]